MFISGEGRDGILPTMVPAEPRRRRRPPSQDAYWLRRVSALVGLLVGVGVVAWVASGFGDPQTEASQVGGTSVPAEAPVPRATVTVTVTATPPPSDYCPDSSIDVKLLADRETYPAGVKPTFTLFVVNVGDTPCRRDVGTGALSLQVLSQGGLVWDLAHCADGASKLRMLRPGEEYRTSVAWDRTSSAPGCQGGAPVEPGTYTLVGAAGDVSSRDLTFYLR